MLYKIIIAALFNLINARDIHVPITEVFKIEVNPLMFNWTFGNQYVYQASLLNSPDLPSWMNYVYSKRNHTGLLYGVPPNRPNEQIPIEIIALNKKNYDTRIERINIIISNRFQPARYEVNMKIDNLNVEDMLDYNKLEALKDVFRKHLWKSSEKDLYMTFLSSAIELGARKPLIPGKEEGVVVRLGSYEEFSSDLQELHKEVQPLFKFPSCPSKKTSVEIAFRHPGFNLEWCSFRLIYNNNSELHRPGVNEKLSSLEENNLVNDQWKPFSKSEIPNRSYYQELVVSLLVPILLMVLLASTLSFILCFHHDDIGDEGSEEFFNNLFHICTDYYYNYYIYRKSVDVIPTQEINQFTSIQRATDSIRSFSKNRDLNMSPDPMLLSRSQTNSPTSTISRGVHCRPSPPPYVRPKFKPEL